MGEKPLNITHEYKLIRIELNEVVKPQEAPGRTTLQVAYWKSELGGETPRLPALPRGPPEGEGTSRPLEPVPSPRGAP